jgi:hypothetical protein
MTSSLISLLTNAYRANSLEAAKQLFRVCDPSKITNLTPILSQAIYDNREDWVRLLLNVGVACDYEAVSAYGHPNSRVARLLANAGYPMDSPHDSGSQLIEHGDPLMDILTGNGFQAVNTC